MALDVKSIGALKPRQASFRVSDGGGLLLLVKPTGAKLWIARITVDGKRRDMGLGGYPVVTLKEAREKAAAAKKAAESGTDPIRQKAAEAKARKDQREAEVIAEARTFRAVAAACIKAETPGWKSSRTAKLWTASLTRHAYPTLGEMPIAEIDRAKVREAIEDVWTSAPSVARKVLQHISTILRYAAAHGWRANDNPADARMLRFTGLPPLRGKKKQPSLPWARMPAFMVALAKMPGLAPVALRFVALTALRSGEVRQARCSWLAFDSVPTLTVPGEVMKGKKSASVQPHRVPLTPAALDTLVLAYGLVIGSAVKVADLPALAALRGDALIFPSAKGTTPLSDMALSAVLRRMNDDRPKGAPAPWRDPDGRQAVPHGLRASFSTWVDDTRPHEREAAEKALAHQVANAVSAAYRRSDLFDRRIPLMAEWAAHCTIGAGEAAQEGRSAAR